MNRTIEHSAFVERSFPDVIAVLARDSPAVLEAATDAASDRVAGLIEHKDHSFPAFDATEILTVVFDRSADVADHHARLEFRWDADQGKRLLANVDARIDIQPLTRSRRAPLTELTLRAWLRPEPGTRNPPERSLLSQRIVRAALHEFLRQVVESLEQLHQPSSTPQLS